VEVRLTQLSPSVPIKLYWSLPLSFQLLPVCINSRLSSVSIFSLSFLPSIGTAMQHQIIYLQIAPTGVQLRRVLRLLLSSHNKSIKYELYTCSWNRKAVQVSDNTTKSI
jgi:hypothetical protein